MNISFRGEEVAEWISLSSPAMTSLAVVSKGQADGHAETRGAPPGPTCPACMIPPPAPVITIQPFSAMRRLNSTAAL
jgi:hypothetical protein